MLFEKRVATLYYSLKSCLPDLFLFLKKYVPMNLLRREFLKNTGLLTIAGLLPTGFIGLKNTHAETNHRYHEPQDFLIRNIHVLSMDEDIGDHERTSVLVKNGKIEEISSHINELEGIPVIDGTDGLLIPGLIDNHWHLWTSLLRSMSGRKEEGYFPMTERFSTLYSPEDMYLAAKYAAAEAINSGVTTLNDFNHNARSPQHVMASFDALAEMGMRGHVAYGVFRDLPEDTPTNWEGIRQVHLEVSGNEKYRNLSLGLGARSVTSPFLKADWQRARDMGLLISIHASSNPQQKGQIAELYKKGLLGNDVNIIHGNSITPEEIKMVKDSGASITMTPFSEMRIGYGLPKLNELMLGGVNLAVGVDTTSLSGNIDHFATMKVLLNLGNALSLNEFHINPKDILKMTTINAARLLGIDDRTGSITPGKAADLIILKKDALNFSASTQPYNLIVEAAQPANVNFVSVGGKILKREGKLTGVDHKDLVNQANTAMRRMQGVNN